MFYDILLIYWENNVLSHYELPILHIN